MLALVLKVVVPTDSSNRRRRAALLLMLSWIHKRQPRRCGFTAFVLLIGAAAAAAIGKGDCRVFYQCLQTQWLVGL